MHSDNVSTTANMTRDRKSTKPIMEKRRRARINASLAELKSLLLEVIKREGARHSKMEKADILEMTVKHLREIQKHTNTGPLDTTTVNKHRLGFSECTQEVSRFLSNIDGCDVDIRTRLLDHLANVVCGTESEKSPPSPTTTPLPVSTPPPLEQLPQSKVLQNSTSGDPLTPPQHLPQATSLVTDLNNNISTVTSPPQVQSTRVVSGLQVIPTKLQNGEIAFVLPGNVVGNSQVPNYIIPVYASPNSSPVKPPAVAMATGTTAPGSFMTIVPSSDVFQTCAITPGSIGIISQPVSSPPSSVSPGSGSDYSISPPVRHEEIRAVRHIHDDVKGIRVVRDVIKDMRHINDDAKDISHVYDNVKELRHVNDDVKEIRHNHNNVRDSVEAHPRQISHSFQIHEPVDTVWRPW